MRLTELQPRWIHPNLLVFFCPHCRQDLLSIKNIVISHREQRELFEKEFGEHWNTLVVPCNPDFQWNISGAMQNLTVTPSIDASPSGHWHGHITRGEIA